MKVTPHRWNPTSKEFLDFASSLMGDFGGNPAAVDAYEKMRNHIDFERDGPAFALKPEFLREDLNLTTDIVRKMCKLGVGLRTNDDFGRSTVITGPDLFQMSEHPRVQTQVKGVSGAQTRELSDVFESSSDVTIFNVIGGQVRLRDDKAFYDIPLQLTERALEKIARFSPKVPAGGAPQVPPA